FHRDTCVNGQRFGLFGFAEAVDAVAAGKDLASIWDRVELDSLAAAQFPSVFSITGRKTNKVYEVLDNVQQFPVRSDQDRWNRMQLVLTYASFLGNNEAYQQTLAAVERDMMSDSVVRQVL